MRKSSWFKSFVIMNAQDILTSLCAKTQKATFPLPFGFLSKGLWIYPMRSWSGKLLNKLTCFFTQNSTKNRCWSAAESSSTWLVSLLETNKKKTLEKRQCFRQLNLFPVYMDINGNCFLFWGIDYNNMNWFTWL